MSVLAERPRTLEGDRAYPTRLAKGLGSHALSLASFELDVLELASQGATVEDVAQELDTEPESVATTRDSVIKKFGANNMAETVNLAILARVIDVEVPEKPVIAVSRRDRKLLNLYAVGRENGEIRRAMKVENKNKIVNWNRWLFKKMNASGKTHSVRRAYELGIFRLPDLG